MFLAHGQLSQETRLLLDFQCSSQLQFMTRNDWGDLDEFTTRKSTLTAFGGLNGVFAA